MVVRRRADCCLMQNGMVMLRMTSQHQSLLLALPISAELVCWSRAYAWRAQGASVSDDRG